MSSSQVMNIFQRGRYTTNQQSSIYFIQVVSSIRGDHPKKSPSRADMGPDRPPWPVWFRKMPGNLKNRIPANMEHGHGLFHIGFHRIRIRIITKMQQLPGSSGPWRTLIPSAAQQVMSAQKPLHCCLKPVGAVYSHRIHGAGIFTYIGIILNYFRGQCR